MSILDISEKSSKYKFNRTVIVYLLISIFTFVVNKVYALFGHGVSSDAMTWMFLYPLIGGGLLFLFIGIIFPKINRMKGYRLFYNLYNSGIAVLIVGSLLKGIMEIAGTSSAYLKLYSLTGYLLIGAGVLLFLVLALNYKELKSVDVKTVSNE